MLKSTFNAAKPSEPKRPTLPHLFRYKDTNGIVCFNTERSGICLVPYGGVSAGQHYGYAVDNLDWVPCWETDTWTPLKPGESITITVEED